MSKLEIDNRWIADYGKAVKVIKAEIETKLSMLELQKENLKQETYYYYLLFKYNNITLQLGGERGAIDFLLTIDGTAVNLYKEDQRFDELSAASENNFIIFIDLLKEYLVKKELI